MTGTRADITLRPVPATRASRSCLRVFWYARQARPLGCACLQCGFGEQQCGRGTQALQQLFVARRILGFSYVAAYYMFDGATFGDDISPAQCSLLRDLFEDAQSMLEAEVRTSTTVYPLTFPFFTHTDR